MQPEGTGGCVPHLFFQKPQKQPRCDPTFLTFTAVPAHQHCHQEFTGNRHWATEVP